MEFNPNNSIVQLCLQGMGMEDKGKPEDAAGLFLKAWNEAANDFEKYLAAYFVARQQNNTTDKLQWLLIALQFAAKQNDPAVNSALLSLHTAIAQCFENLNDLNNAKHYYELAGSATTAPKDSGPFYHGTRAALKVGDLLTAGFGSNYQQNLIMNHIYFTALLNGAGLAASLAKGDGRERVYIVEPTGDFEHDPNVTDKKFPGNITRSYRTEKPLKIVGEVTDWAKQTSGELQKWREKLAKNKGDIIN